MVSNELVSIVMEPTEVDHNWNCLLHPKTYISFQIR